MSAASTPPARPGHARPPTPGMRRMPSQQRSQARVARILDSLSRLSAAAGYAAVTIADIARGADIPVGTFYQFFPSKEAAMASLGAGISADLDSFLATLDPGLFAERGAEAYVRGLVEGIAKLQAQHASFVCIYTAAQPAHPLAALATDLRGRTDAHMAAALERAHPDWPASLRACRVTVVGAMASGIIAHMPADQRLPRHELVEELIAAIAAYLARPADSSS